MESTVRPSAQSLSARHFLIHSLQAVVDWGPYSGSFQGVTVAKNTIISQSNASHGLLLLVDHDLSHAFLQFIKLGIAVGPMTWGVDNRTVARTYGGTVMGNNFVSGPTGYFGYAIGVAGHNGVTLSGNNARQANFGGVESPACFTVRFLPATLPEKAHSLMRCPNAESIPVTGPAGARRGQLDDTTVSLPEGVHVLHARAGHMPGSRSHHKDWCDVELRSGCWVVESGREAAAAALCRIV